MSRQPYLVYPFSQVELPPEAVKLPAIQVTQTDPGTRVVGPLEQSQANRVILEQFGTISTSFAVRF
jgi:hypothetical protein